MIYYECAGYGSSEPGPILRSGLQVVRELNTLLKNAGEKGPYVLVGHSLGGLNMMIYADQFPKQTAGLVLLDPSPLAFLQGKKFSGLYQLFHEQTAYFRELAKNAAQTEDPSERARENFYLAIASEHESLLSDTADRLATIQTFGDLPLVVIGSEKPNPAFQADAEAFQQFWIEENRTLSQESTRGEYILATGTSHATMYTEAPQVVLDAIMKVIQQAQ